MPSAKRRVTVFSFSCSEASGFWHWVPDADHAGVLVFNPSGNQTWLAPIIGHLYEKFICNWAIFHCHLWLPRGRSCQFLGFLFHSSALMNFTFPGGHVLGGSLTSPISSCCLSLQYYNWINMIGQFEVVAHVQKQINLSTFDPDLICHKKEWPCTNAGIVTLLNLTHFVNMYT